MLSPLSFFLPLFLSISLSLFSLYILDFLSSLSFLRSLSFSLSSLSFSFRFLSLPSLYHNLFCSLSVSLLSSSSSQIGCSLYFSHAKIFLYSVSLSLYNLFLSLSMNLEWISFFLVFSIKDQTRKIFLRGTY